MEPTYDEVLNILEKVRNLRGLGHQLLFQIGDLNRLDEFTEYKERRIEFYKRWRALKHTFSWTALRDALLAPQLNQRRLADEITKKIQDHSHLIKQGSTDSAISGMSSPTSASSVLSVPSPGVLPLQDFMCEDCNVLNIVNAIYSKKYPFNWRLFGEHFKLQSSLAEIKGKYLEDEFIVRVIELWYFSTPSDQCTWERLQEGLRPAGSVLEASLRLREPHSSGIIEERRDETVMQEMQQLGKDFKTLIKDIQKYLDSQKEVIADVFDTVMYDEQIKIVYSKILEEKFHALDKSENFGQFFRHLSQCLNFIDFHVLECVIEQHGSPELKSRFNSYYCAVKNFRKSTTVGQLLRLWKPPPRYRPALIPDGYKDYVAQLNRRPERCTLQDLESLRNDSRNSIQDAPLLTAAIILCEVSPGSITVFWKVEEGVVDQLFKALSELIGKNLEFIQRYDITVLLLDDFIISPHDCIEQHFWNSCRAGHFSAVKESLLTESNVRGDPQYVCEVSGWSVLMCVAKYGHLNILELLVEFGAEVDAQDKAGCTALRIAVEAGQIGAAQLLLEMGADPDIQDTVCGWSPLMVALDKDDLPLTKLLCKETNLNVMSLERKTALVLAIERNNLEMVKMILNKEFLDRIDVSIQDEKGHAAIHAAVESGNVEIVELLINLFPDTRDTENRDGKRPVDLAKQLGNRQEIVVLLSPEELEEEFPAAGTGRLQRVRSSIVKFFRNFRLRDIKLMRAAKSGNHNTVEELLKRGADPNTKEVDYLQWTPLMWASRHGHTETVKVLLKYKADPNIKANNGFTALILASIRGRHEVVAVLVDPSNPIKTDLDVKNSLGGWTALMWAAQTNSLSNQSNSKEAKADRRKVVEHLLAAGADVNLKANNGWTPLMQASQDGDPELVEIFCKAQSVNLDHQSDSTWSPLTTACRKKNTDIVKVLVKHGARVDLQKKGGVSAMHIASFNNMLEATKSMVEEGSGNVNIQDEWGMTPLILAAKQSHGDLMRYFVAEANADVNIQAEKYARWSALFFSIKNGDQGLVDFLIQNKANPFLLDKNQHNCLTYSKSLLLREKATMYKRLVNKLFSPEEEGTPSPLEDATARSRQSVDRKNFTPVDAVLYSSTEVAWRATQLRHITDSLNIIAS